MQRQPRSIDDAVRLLQLSELIASSTRIVIDEWTKESKRAGITGEDGSPAVLPNWRLYQAQRELLAAAGTLTELASDPSSRLQEVSGQYFEARALHIAAEKRIADLIAELDTKGDGVEGNVIAEKTGIEARKLTRILRCLCSIHIFREVGPGRFSNNGISAALVKNEPLRAYMLLFGYDLYTASDHLPKYLSNPEKGHSYDVQVTPFQDAVGTSKPRWEWLEEKVSVKEINETKPGYPGVPTRVPIPEGGDENSLVPRPELETFGLAMLGGGRVTGAAHPFDYPWGELGKGTVVDVGGGVGGFVMQLSRRYPELRLVVEDRGPVLKQAQTEVWPRDHPEALKDGRVTFIEHDFFNKNPVENADVYFLRYILHDWSDDYCVRILSAIRDSMGPHSRILVCDQVMNTTLGSPELTSAPAPLLANYGYHTRYSHTRDLAMMSIINGIERTPAEFKDIVEKAGLKLQKIWDCRSAVSLVEIVKGN